MERKKLSGYSVDRYSPHTPVEYEKEKMSSTVELAKEQLLELQGSLRSLYEHIQEKKPDVVFFLDKSARIFATPLRQVMQERDEVLDTKFLFLNDKELKYLYVSDEEERLKEKMSEVFSPYTGKTVVFVDETYSGGKGAYLSTLAMDELSMNGEYISLSHDPREMSVTDDNALSLEAHKANIEKISSDPRVLIGEPEMEYLFSKEASYLYVSEDRVGGKIETIARYAPIATEDLEDAYTYEGIHARNFGSPPEGHDDYMSYDKDIHEIHMATARELKKMIKQAIDDSLENNT